jgi:hypothetical protein
MNLTSLCQHHLQYTGGLAETQGLLLQFVYCDSLHATHQTLKTYQFFSEFCKRYLVLSEHFAFTSVKHNNG